MKPRVQQKLDQVFSYPFFESVGKPLPPCSVTQIKTWRSAVEECSKLKWANSTLMARNVTTSLKSSSDCGVRINLKPMRPPACGRLPPECLRSGALVHEQSG